MCPHSGAFTCYICVLMLLYMCPHTAIYVSSFRCLLRLPPGLVSAKKKSVLILLYMCPHTTRFVSLYYYIRVLIQLYMCPHSFFCLGAFFGFRLCLYYIWSAFQKAPFRAASSTQVLSYGYICVLMLLYICVLILLSMCPHMLHLEAL